MSMSYQWLAERFHVGYYLMDFPIGTAVDSPLVPEVGVSSSDPIELFPTQKLILHRFYHSRSLWANVGAVVGF